MVSPKDVKDAKRLNKIQSFNKKQTRKDVRIADKQQAKKERRAGRQYRLNVRTEDDRGGKHLKTASDLTQGVVKSIAENADKLEGASAAFL